MTIATLTGDNGILAQAKKAQESTEVAKFVDEASLAYHELYIEKAQNGNYEISEREVLDRLEDKYGYTGKIIHGTTGTLTGITVNLETTADSRATVGIGKTKIVKVTPEGLTENNYVEINGLYYPISYNDGKITLGEGIAEEPSTGGSGTYTLSATSSATAKATVDCNQTAKTVTISGVANGNIYLIYANYLESAQIPESTENGIAKDGYNVYVDTTNYSGKTRDNLIAYLSNESTSASGIWSGFAEGVENALNSKLEAGQKLTAGTVKAYGAPTVEQFKGSYLENYPTSGFDAKEVSQGDDFENTGSSSAEADGYVYKIGSGNYRYNVSLGNANKALYFPVTSLTKETTSQTYDSYGYCLARFLSWSL